MSLEARDRCGQRRTVELRARIGKGGEGEVYTDALRPDRVVKLFAAGTGERKVDKLAAMLARPPSGQMEEHAGRSIVQIAWPLETVHEGDDRLVGYTMRNVDFASTAPLDGLFARSARDRHRLPDEFRFRVYAARNLAALLGHLHAVGHHMVDTKPQNIRVYRDGALVCLLDCDGYAIDGADARHPATVRTFEFLAPEAFEKAPDELGLAQDRFGLAVILFELLANGVHPCAGTELAGEVPPDIAGRLQRQLFFIGPRPSLRTPWNSTYEFLLPTTRALFEAALLGPPDARPSAETWAQHLSAATNELVGCVRDEEHVHFGPRCPWCALAAKRAEIRDARARTAHLDGEDAAALAAFVPHVARRWQGKGATVTRRVPRQALPPIRRGHGRRRRRARALLVAAGTGLAVVAGVVLTVLASDGPDGWRSASGSSYRARVSAFSDDHPRRSNIAAGLEAQDAGLIPARPIGTVPLGLRSRHDGRPHRAAHACGLGLGGRPVEQRRWATIGWLGSARAARASPAGQAGRRAGARRPRDLPVCPRAVA